MTPGSVGDHLSALRHDRYVGRGAELALFAEALAADRLPFHVVHVYGPGGVGKTALLDEVARLASESGAWVARLDGRDIGPAPTAFGEAAARGLDAAPSGSRRVLLVDTYERLLALDGWLRRTFVPGLQSTDLVVIAGRPRPAHEWRADWGGGCRMISLRNLSDAEAREYLSAQQIPEAVHDDVLAFTHGHPLALALVAEWVRQQNERAPLFDAGAAPALVGDLLARFVSSVPTPAHRAALEAASVVRSVTVPLLAAVMDGEADRLFGWLRKLAFTEADASGLRLHEVVRETIEADLRWRDPDRHDAFHRRARREFGRLLREASTDAERHRALSDYADLYRHNPVVRPLLRRLHERQAEAQVSGAVPLRAGDAAAIAALVRQHQGAAEAALVAGWLERQPSAAEVFVAADGSVAGFLLTLDLAEMSPEEREADPVVQAAWAAVGASLRAGERGLLFRCWLDAEHGQGVSVVQSLAFARTVERYLTTPGLAVSALLTTEPDLWGMVLRFAGIHRRPEAEAEGGPAAFVQDWRATSPEAWLDALAERTPSQAPARPDPADTLVVLSRDAFAEAVREALKTAARPHRLAESPLLQARLVREHEGEPVETLQRLIAEAAAQLDLSSRERPYFRALDLTYLHPAPSQAIASERLDVPFSTYRRHLKRGVDHVIDALWRAETGDDRPG